MNKKFEFWNSKDKPRYETVLGSHFTLDKFDRQFLGKFLQPVTLFRLICIHLAIFLVRANVVQSALVVFRYKNWQQLGPLGRHSNQLHLAVPSAQNSALLRTIKSTG